MATDRELVTERANKKHKTDDSAHDVDTEGPIEADFLFNDPAPEDYSGILAIIQGYLKKVPWQPPQGCEDSIYGLLSTLISEQPNLGTLIKTDNDDGEEAFVMAVLSILNLRMYPHLESLSHAIIALTERHGSKKDLETITKILSDDKNQVGFIVNERLGNIPTQLIGSLHQCICDDIKWSVENADDDEEREFYKFTHLIGISRVFTDNSKSFEAKNMAYVKPEERFYSEEALVKYMWNTGESNKIDFFEDGDQQSPKSKMLPEAMMLYCINFERLKRVVQRITSMFA